MGMLKLYLPVDVTTSAPETPSKAPTARDTGVLVVSTVLILWMSPSRKTAKEFAVAEGQTRSGMPSPVMSATRTSVGASTSTLEAAARKVPSPTPEYT